MSLLALSTLPEYKFSMYSSSYLCRTDFSPPKTDSFYPTHISKY